MLAGTPLGTSEINSTTKFGSICAAAGDVVDQDFPEILGESYIEKIV